MNCKKMLGQRIKELRKRYNLTQEKLSELVGFEPNHMSKIEAGIHFPQPEKLDLIAKVFDLPVKELFDYEHKISEQTLKNKIKNWVEDADSLDVEYIYKTITNLKDLKRGIKI